MARVLVVRAHPFDSSVSRSMKVLDAFSGGIQSCESL